MKHILKNKGLLIGGAVAIVVIIILVIVVVALVKKKKAETVKLPKDTIWGAGLTDEESDTIVRIANELYKDMKGWNISPFDRNHQIYYEYSTTSDKIFVAVANYFAEKYGNGKNLAQWINGEYYSWSKIQTQGVADGIIARLAQFGITC